MRRVVLLVAVGCGGEKGGRGAPPGDVDTAADSGASGDSGGEAPVDSGEDSGDSAPIDTADTAPPGDSADTGPAEPPVDCDALPPTPVMFKMLTGFAPAEDFTFDGAGNYLAFDGTTLVSIDIAGSRSALVPMGGSFSPTGTHLLADGDVVVNNRAADSVLRVGLDGSQTAILTGVSYPNGLTVSVDNQVYVSGMGMGWIYEVDPDTHDYAVIATGLEGANGLAFSPDNQTLYVGDFNNGLIWAIDRDGKGGWLAPRELHDLPANVDGLNVDECGNVYATDFGYGRVWKVDPDDPSVAVLAAQLPAGWIPNLHWGRGLGGFDDRTLYVGSLEGGGSLLALDVGVGSTPQAFVVPAE